MKKVIFFDHNAKVIIGDSGFSFIQRSSYLTVIFFVLIGLIFFVYSINEENLILILPGIFIIVIAALLFGYSETIEFRIKDKAYQRKVYIFNQHIINGDIRNFDDNKFKIEEVDDRDGGITYHLMVNYNNKYRSAFTFNSEETAMNFKRIGSSIGIEVGNKRLESIYPTI